MWFRKKEPIKKTGLCTLYLNCGNVTPDKAEDLIKKYKSNIFEHQGLDNFLMDNNHHFVIIPVFGEPTRMEFVWF